jgi:hypothetical protein
LGNKITRLMLLKVQSSGMCVMLPWRAFRSIPQLFAGRAEVCHNSRDWFFLVGRPREKVFSLHLWLRFAALWLTVVVIGFVEGYVLLPFGVAAFLGAVFLTALVVWRFAPKWLR